MSKKNFKVYFYQLSLFDGQNTGYSLEIFLSEYFRNMKNRRVDRQEGYVVYLEKVDNINEDTMLSYANFNYGEEKEIVNTDNMQRSGTLEKNESLKDIQYIALTKKKENIYNICIQSKKSGLIAGSFLFLLNQYLLELKKKDSSKNQIHLSLRPFYPIDFFEKINSLNSRKIVVDGKMTKQQDPDANFSEKYNTKISQTIIITPAERKGLFKKNNNLGEYLKELCKDFDTVKLNATGEDEQGEKIKIYSERCQASEEIKIKVDDKGRIGYNDVKDALEDFLGKLKNFKGVLI